MDIKKFEDFNVDTGISGIITSTGRRIPSTHNRNIQYFYDYYTGKKITGKSKYELNTRVFELAKRNDDIGLLAQFCLQIERESMSYDYELKDQIKKSN